MKTRGFTIIEMTVVIALGSAMLAVALPKAWRFADGIEVRGAVTEIESMFSLARHTAITRGAQVTLDIDVMRGTISIRQGQEAIESREVGLAHKVTLAANRTSITYSPLGVGYGAANFSLVVARNSVTDTIVVSRLGRVRH